MTRHLFAPLCALALASWGPDAASAQASELEAGRWKLHVTSTTNGKADPAQDTEECLHGEQLKDLGAYFAPTLEGVEARCERTRLPSSDPRKIDHRARCTGADFTWEATSSVTVESGPVHGDAADGHADPARVGARGRGPLGHADRAVRAGAGRVSAAPRACALART